MSKEIERQLSEQREGLDDIRNEVASCKSAFTRTLGTIAKSLAGLKEEKLESARTLSFVKQNTIDKEKVEKDLRSGLAEKQLEIQRLSKALTKAKQDEKKWKDELSLQQNQNADLEKRLEESARSETEARRRLSISETSSSNRKEVMSLSSLVEANKSEVERLCEELELQSKSHSLRIAELQESFQAKIREMRRVHAEQLSSSRSQLEDEIRSTLMSQSEHSLSEISQENLALSNEIKTLKSDLTKVKEKLSDNDKKLEESQRKEADGRKRIYMLEKQNKTMSTKIEELKMDSEKANDRSKLEEQNKAMAVELDKIKAELKAKVAELNEKGKENKNKEDLSMLDIMEEQLVKLSNLLNSKEEEIEALKSTVERECFERGHLMSELTKLRANLLGR